jgi:hypothetical protein
MRSVLLLLIALLALPIAAAHDENVLYRLVVEPGAGAGPVTFSLESEHGFLGVGVSGCTLGSAGAFRLVTPAQSVIEVTLNGLPACESGVTALAGDSTTLPPGVYAGGYAFALTAPLTIVIYASD